jgi:hypothetical protein
MLYRAHRTHKPNGTLGQLLGYLSLCIGHITNQHICESLYAAKLIPQGWLTPEQLQVVPYGSLVAGAYAYNIFRIPTSPFYPHKKCIFYLNPIEHKKEAAENALGMPYGTAMTTGGGGIYSTTVAPTWTNYTYANNNWIIDPFQTQPPPQRNNE